MDLKKLVFSRAKADSTGLQAYFVSNVRHLQWAIPQTQNEGSMFIHVGACFFRFPDETYLFFV